MARLQALSGGLDSGRRRGVAPFDWDGARLSAGIRSAAGRLSWKRLIGTAVVITAPRIGYWMTNFGATSDGNGVPLSR